MIVRIEIMRSSLQLCSVINRPMGFVPNEYNIQYTVSRSKYWLQGHPLDSGMATMRRVKFQTSKITPLPLALPVLLGVPCSPMACHPLNLLHLDRINSMANIDTPVDQSHCWLPCIGFDCRSRGRCVGLGLGC